MTANGKHLSVSGRWGTPPDIVDRSRDALGGRIELDPMSEPDFNEIVGAERIYTELDDGLTQDWTSETLFLNPHKGLVERAWRKLCSEFFVGNVRKAIWIGFSMEQLNLLACEIHYPLDFSTLICRKRIDFLRPDGKPAGSPSHGNYIVGIGIDADIFERAFVGLGRFSHGGEQLRWKFNPEEDRAEQVFGGDGPTA